MDVMDTRRTAAAMAGAGFTVWSLRMTEAANEIERLHGELARYTAGDADLFHMPPNTCSAAEVSLIPQPNTGPEAVNPE